MNIIIGCSPSTGSSLLCQILNRHPELYCGPESNLFIYPDLFLSWNESKSLINSGKGSFFHGFKNMKFYLKPKLNIPAVDGLDIDANIDKSESLIDFADAYFKASSLKSAKNYWVEKTPANALCFPLLDKYFPEIQLASIVRNPLDAIYSMLRRGMTLYRAASSYLLYTSHILSVAKVEYIHYEDLVRTPESTLRKFMEDMNLYFHEDMLKVTEGEADVQMEGWTYAENREIGKAAIDRFHTAPEHVKAEILYAIRTFKINKKYRDRNNLRFTTILDIADYLDYSIPNYNKESRVIAFGQQIWKDQLNYLMMRWRYGFFNYGFSYPVEVK